MSTYTQILYQIVFSTKRRKPALLKENRLFPDFEDWQVGYGAFTYSFKEKDTLIEYVKNQEEHHKTKTYREELIELLREHGIEFEERYLE